MRVLIGGILLFLSTGLFAQQSADSMICDERGHVTSGFGSETLMYCPPYVIDTDSVSYRVYPNCNIRTMTCDRCGEVLTEGGRADTVVIWRKGENLESSDSYYFENNNNEK